MNSNTTHGTTSATTTAAIIRGVYNAVGTFAATTLAMYAYFDSWEPALVAGALGGLSALGFRSVGEGVYDVNRQKAGKVSDADVQPN